MLPAVDTTPTDKPQSLCPLYAEAFLKGKEHLTLKLVQNTEKLQEGKERKVRSMSRKESARWRMASGKSLLDKGRRSTRPQRALQEGRPCSQSHDTKVLPHGETSRHFPRSLTQQGEWGLVHMPGADWPLRHSCSSHWRNLYFEPA